MNDKLKMVPIPKTGLNMRSGEAVSNDRALRNVDVTGRPLSLDKLSKIDAHSRPQETPKPKSKALPPTTYVAVVTGELPNDGQRWANIRRANSEKRDKNSRGG